MFVFHTKKGPYIKGNNQDWFDNEVHEAIRERDKLYSKFKKTDLTMITKTTMNHVT